MKTFQQRCRAVIILTLVLVACGLSSRSRTTPTAELPDSSVILRRIGKRLSQTKSTVELTRIVARESRLIPLLNGVERDTLGRSHLRLTIDSPATILLATDARHVPFWLDDQGFRERPESFKNAGSVWRLFEKRFPAGIVGLGVDRLDATSLQHYEVFVRRDDGRPIARQALSDPRWTVSKVGDEALALPSILIGTTRLKPEPELRNSTILAKGRVWKTHVVASYQPDQVHVSPGQDSSTELVISWRTAPESSKSVVRFREAGRPDTTLDYIGTSRLLRTPSVLNDPEVRLHCLSLSGLVAKRDYEYSVGDGTEKGMSPWSSIRTAPGRYDDVQLLYMGDPQCGLEGWGKLLSAARERHPSASALLIAGDLVDRGNERTNWDHFFLRAAGVFEELPILPAVGNHEYLDQGPRLYQSFFRLPSNGPKTIESGLVYSVEIGDAFIAVLDSTLAVSNPGSARVQASWLEAKLASTTRTWKIVMFHHPLYVSHTWRENLALREAWMASIERGGVNLVLQGHDHAYLRTYPLLGSQRARSTNEGTTYVVAVSGDKYCEQKSRDYTEVGFTNRSTYQTIDVKPTEGRMIYRAFDIKGNELDRAEWLADKKAGVIAGR